MGVIMETNVDSKVMNVICGGQNFYQIPVLGTANMQDQLQASAESCLDINRFLLGKAGPSSYVLRVKSNDHLQDGIMAGDRVLVDVQTEAGKGDLVITLESGGYRLQRLFNPAAATVWGVVTGVVRKLPSNRG